MRSNWKPAFRYELRDMLMGSWPFLTVIAVLVIASMAGTFLFDGGEIRFSGYGMVAAICLFVFGVVEPRAYLRLCAQLGVCRRTAFVSGLLAAAVDSAVLAVAGEALFAAATALAAPDVYFFDLYQILYLGQSVDIDTAWAMTLPQHLTSILFNTGLLWASYAFGMFFTFLFWRLSKLWTVVAAISIPLLLNGVPLLVYRSPALSRAALALFQWLAASAWNLLALFVLAAAVFAAVSWLLVRRTNIRAPSGK